MNKTLKYSLAGAAMAAAGYAAWRQFSRADLPVADNVDLDRYMGLWYEIARLPAPFERKCMNTTAQYAKNPDGTVKVINSCTRSSNTGKESATEGVAYVADTVTNAKLKIQFQWPFKGDYFILDVGKDYDYALIGSPSRRYLWILSRKPELDKTIAENLIRYAQDLGFNTEKLIFTEHQPDQALKHFEMTQN